MLIYLVVFQSSSVYISSLGAYRCEFLLSKRQAVAFLGCELDEKDFHLLVCSTVYKIMQLAYVSNMRAKAKKYYYNLYINSI